MGATIRDIAKTCGVSIGTVSGVLNKKLSVKEETRNKIHEAARKLKYAPFSNTLARQSSKTNTLGLVLPFMNLTQGSFFARFLQCAKNICGTHSYDVILYTEEDIVRKTTEEYHLGSANLHCDSVIVFSPYGSYDEYLAVLSEWGVPSVLIRRSVSIPGIIMINNDEAGGMKAVLEHLVSLGHSRIGLITRQTSKLRRPELFPDPRAAAFHGFLKDKGLPDKAEWAADIADDDEYAACLNTMLQRKDAPTAFFCYNDELAAITIRILEKIGKKVPDDIALVSYDNDIFATAVNPRLTTVNLPVERITELACKAVFEGVLGDGTISGMTINVKDELIVRESSGKRRSADDVEAGAD